MPKTRILFVDDEPNVLQGLQRMLRPLREQWSIDTVANGPDALAHLARQPYDVVVSDMRMPGMDGAELLNRVMQEYPAIIRIVLSGHSPQEDFFKALGPMHQYLTKPCSLPILKSSIERACTLRDFLASNTALRALVPKLRTLPSLPALYTEVLTELKKREPSLEKISQLIFQDPAMTAKILQLVNSPFFGFFSEITDPLRAINILGLDMMRSLVLLFQIFEQFDPLLLKKLKLDQLWRHQLGVAQTAKKIALLWGLGKEGGEDAFLAGLLHDLGQMILAVNCTAAYQAILDTSAAQQRAQSETERRSLGVTHAEIGAYLLGLWGLPTMIVETTLYHHALPAQPVPPSALSAVFVAEAFSDDPASEEARAYFTQAGLLASYPQAQALGAEVFSRAPELRGDDHA